MSIQPAIRRYGEDPIHLEFYEQLGREIRLRHFRVARWRLAREIRRLVADGRDRLHRPARVSSIGAPAEEDRASI